MADPLSPFDSLEAALTVVGRTPLVLRGLHRFGFEGSVRGLGFPNNFTPIEIRRAKEWGANVIRLSLASPFWRRCSCG